MIRVVFEPTVIADSDDDQVLACALAGNADYVVSGDPHLLEIHEYNDIPILTASEFLSLLDSQNDEKHHANDH